MVKRLKLNENIFRDRDHILKQFNDILKYKNNLIDLDQSDIGIFDDDLKQIAGYLAEIGDILHDMFENPVRFR